MISVMRVCPKCGAEIPADAPEEGCPGCLSKAGLICLIVAFKTMRFTAARMELLLTS